MLAERLRAAMADSVILPGATITASVGVASVDFAVEAPKTLRELISAADRLLN